jgi:hypothetical protein
VLISTELVQKPRYDINKPYFCCAVPLGVRLQFCLLSEALFLAVYLVYTHFRYSICWHHYTFLFVLFLWVGWNGVHYYSGHYWPIVPVPDDDGCWVWSSGWYARQGKPKYSEKTCPSVASSTTNPTWPDPGSNSAAAVGSRRLTAWTTAQPIMITWHVFQWYMWQFGIKSDGALRLSTVSTWTGLWSLYSQMNLVHTSYPSSLRSALILYFHVCLRPV